MSVFTQSVLKLLLCIRLYSDFFFPPPLNFSSEVFSSFPLNVSPITKWLWGRPEDSTKKNVSEHKARCQMHLPEENYPTSPYSFSAFMVLYVSLDHKPTGRFCAFRIYSASGTLQMLKRCLSLEICNNVKL